VEQQESWNDQKDWIVRYTIGGTLPIASIGQECKHYSPEIRFGGFS
jgi:hypothetical protein